MTVAAGDVSAMQPTVTAALAGRRAAALLDSWSVQRMVALLETRCREASWARVAVATLERFRDLTGADLDSLLGSALVDPAVGDAALRRFGTLLSEHGPAHTAALSFGAKVWFRANGAAVAWRRLSSVEAVRPVLDTEPDLDTRLLLLTVIGSGLSVEEAMRLRIGDLGSLDADGNVVPDLGAEPLAASYRPDEGGPARVTFLTYAARSLWLTGSAERPDLDPAGPFVAAEAVDRAAVAERAGARHAALIAAGNDVNVATCRLTGDFFREWGMPGARFEQRQRLAEAGRRAGQLIPRRAITSSTGVCQVV